jgi:hypothetical protein
MVPSETIPAGQPVLLNGANFVAQLSSNGTYVVARQDYLENWYGGDAAHIGSALHVWTLQTPTPTEEDIVTVLPTASRDVEVMFRYARTEIAISPDEQYVAVEFQDALALYTLPDLALSQMIPTSAAHDGLQKPGLIWSPDSRFVANIREQQLLVFDRQMDEIYTYEFEFEQPSYGLYGPIVSVSQAGWLLDYFDEPAITFLYCDWKLTNCQSYDYDDVIHVVSSPDGSLVLTRWNLAIDEHPIPTGVWHLQSNGIYQLDGEILNIENDFLPIYFSPHGEYVLFRGNSRAEIRRTSDWSLAQTLRQGDRPVWFPDENYFSIWSPFDGVSLYRLGEETPYETLNYFPMLDTDAIARLDNSVAELSVDRSGRYMLFRAGWLNLVIPINYETPSSRG